MQFIEIDSTELPSRPQFICDKAGRLDLLGQIITQLGCDVPPGTRTPNSLSRAVDPISNYIRQFIILTPAGYNLLMATSLPTNQQIQAANRILNPFSITIITPLGPSHTKLPPVNTVRAEVEQWLGMSIPPEFEETFQNSSRLKLSPEKISEIICDLM